MGLDWTQTSPLLSDSGLQGTADRAPFTPLPQPGQMSRALPVPSLAGPAVPMLVSLSDKLLLAGTKMLESHPRGEGISHQLRPVPLAPGPPLGWPQGTVCRRTGRACLAAGVPPYQLGTCSLSGCVPMSQQETKTALLPWSWLSSAGAKG